ncbi:carboxymuconolactone decarboxylase family protein [Nocardioides insulae]|uniref:carboxymuconolactone decarboxylase family protein n=1 Tax=Nocardioides insulae TaxID=394734 RepID=UPI0003FA8E10|nr:carboxymuconolactone decarboxylase family protein [Nocardioides insulae]
MPRLRQVPRHEVDDDRVLSWYDRLFGDRDPVAEPGTASGTPGDWWTVFALSPDILRHATAGFAVYRSPERRLDPVLRELGQARAGWVRGSQFVFSQHCKSLRDLGVSEERIAAVSTGAASPLFDEAERYVLAYTDALVDQGGRVSDGLFAGLREHLDDLEILELTYITAMYDMHAVIAKALHLEYDNREDPIVEIGGGGLNG